MITFSMRSISHIIIKRQYYDIMIKFCPGLFYNGTLQQWLDIIKENLVKKYTIATKRMEIIQHFVIQNFTDFPNQNGFNETKNCDFSDRNSP